MTTASVAGSSIPLFLLFFQQLSAGGIVFAAGILEFRRLGGAKNSG
jgi:hypothetical protein